MQLKISNLSTAIKLACCAFLALGLVAQVQAQDSKPDGKWSWTTPGRNGGEGRKMTLTLKTEGEKLTGKLAMPARNGETRDVEIKDGKVTGGDISFKVVREFNGREMSQKYNGKVTGDTIKGKIEFTNRDGEAQSRDWEAKREK